MPRYGTNLTKVIKKASPGQTAPSKSPNVLWGIIIVAFVIVGDTLVILENGSGHPSQNGQTITASQGEDPFSGGIGVISSLIEIIDVKTTLDNGFHQLI